MFEFLCILARLARLSVESGHAHFTDFDRYYDHEACAMVVSGSIHEFGEVWFLATLDDLYARGNAAVHAVDEHRADAVPGTPGYSELAAAMADDKADELFEDGWEMLRERSTYV